MQAAEFATASGVTVAYTMRGTGDLKCCSGIDVDVDVADDDKDNLNEVIFGDSWFSSIKSTCQVWNRFKCCYDRFLKTNHSWFPKA